MTKTYGEGERAVEVLHGVDLVLARGEFVALMGPSGSGKSTLLNIVGLLDSPTGGVLRLEGRETARLADAELTRLRGHAIGFVFQYHHLIGAVSALENVMMPMRIGGTPPAEARSRAEQLLSRVGLSGRMQHRPSELSGGEQQRTAVARALAVDPAVLLADEPSGNLDHANSERLHDLFAELARDLESGMVVVTHHRSLAARADRTLLLEDGRLLDHDVREAVT